MSTSQNGWPAFPEATNPLLHVWDLRDRKDRSIAKVRLRTGSAGFLLCHFALWFHDEVEPIDGKVLDDWGYSFRPIRGETTGLSNHASGTALDLNATKHPLGQVGTFTPAQTARIRKRLRMYHGVIRWGGDYTGRKDEMHFEINRPLPVAEQLARPLIPSLRGIRVLKHNPHQKAVIRS